MKIRQGFVSNSSTTSFCIFGTYDSAKDMAKKVIANLSEEEMVDLSNALSLSKPLDEYNPAEIGECLDHVLTTGGLTHVDSICNYDDWGDEVYLGVYPEGCPDDMKMGDWKAEVTAAFRRLLGSDYTLSWISEGWYNG